MRRGAKEENKHEVRISSVQDRGPLGGEKYFLDYGEGEHTREKKGGSDPLDQPTTGGWIKVWTKIKRGKGGGSPTGGRARRALNPYSRVPVHGCKGKQKKNVRTHCSTQKPPKVRRGTPLIRKAFLRNGGGV